VLEKLTQRIREEFEETPGLQVTVGEGARFWGLDEMTCYQVLVRLRASGILTVDADHRYRHALVDSAADAQDPRRPAKAGHYEQRSG
jgi:hypothetical protein